MLAEYDFSKGIRGKYVHAYADKTLTLTDSEWKAYVRHLKKPKQSTKALKSLMKIKGFDN